MSATKRVEIVIPVHNRRELTLQCLRSLERVRRDGLSVHLIVVDDGSSDGTSDAISKHFPEVQIIKGDGNLFFTAATNRGIEAALACEPDYIVTMNDDAVFDEGFLVSLVGTAEQHPRTVVGALLLLWDEPHRVFQVSPKWDTWSGGYRHWSRQTVFTVPESPWEVELIVGNCVLFPAAAVRECGLMDEVRLPQFGDAEFTPRMKKAGWRLAVDPRARVFCQPNEPPKRLRSQNPRQVFEALLTNPYSAHSLRRRLNANLFGGPTKLAGAAAFMIFMIRWFLGRSLEGDFGLKLEERPLAETFGNKVLRSPRL